MFTKLLPLLILLLGVARAELQVGFYSQSCPEAESIISGVVSEAVKADPQMSPVLLRLLFHDCFVDGCDGSILLESGENSERFAPAHAGVRGFDVIETAKEKVEAVCRGVVSCADIVALATRDAVALAKGPLYEVATGRKDGRVSNADHAADVPDIDESIKALILKFQEKGLTEKDLVLLTAGAHTIGTTACFFMENRLYDFNGTGNSDPAIDPAFLRNLKNTCRRGGDLNVRLSLDPTTNNTFDDKPVNNISRGFAVLASDARLMDDPVTKGVVESYLNHQEASFESDFAESIVKMGSIGVKSGAEGEIRKHCSQANSVL